MHRTTQITAAAAPYTHTDISVGEPGKCLSLSDDGERMAAPIIMANNIWSSRNIYWSDLNVVKLLNSISRLGQKRRRPTQPSQEAAFLSKQVLNHPNGCQDSSGIEEKNMCIPLPATAATAAAAVTGNLLLPRANKVVGMIKTHTTGSVYD